MHGRFNSYDMTGSPTIFKGVTKTYNANNQQTGTGFVHDGNGNPTSYGGVSLTFDSENRLTSYGSALTAGYTGDGLRAWKRPANASTTYFLYDGTLPIIELDKEGGITAVNTFGANGLVSRRTDTSTFYTFDPQGSVVQRLDATGAVLSSHQFTAHGVEVTAASTDPFGYGAQWGYYTDRETGLQLLTHRYYDPQAGRFLTRDPLGYAGGVNLYAYVENNPVLFVDPTGLERLSTYTGTWPPRGPAPLPISGPPNDQSYGVYRCTREIIGKEWFPAGHDYLCTADPQLGKKCSGLVPDPSSTTRGIFPFFPASGFPDLASDFKGGRCTLATDSPCITRCVQGASDAPRGNYNVWLLGGDNCWSWAGGNLQRCAEQCR